MAIFMGLQDYLKLIDIHSHFKIAVFSYTDFS
ncbi:hypothetical protein swp_0139 [Shewanella piezotolerans WP3]|uniref:Uncharacterized protein n=1 Tax=Shewanella piezotolerans (strain WP3 / JCM 13877) TaxID=225849 RepID=B8CGZ0_SHEPW|nr:hypothetical protein swp_0139 [Shewanella piezotolerans WP3]